MSLLRCATPGAWVEVVRENLDAFLQDHAANERKAAASALTLAAQHPDRTVLVDAMIDFAREELEHFRQVYDALRRRGCTLAQDSPDPYMTALRRLERRADGRLYLLDRLLVFAAIEARGCERFALLAQSLEEGPLRDLYRRLARAEERHRGLFVELAHEYFDPAEVAARLAEVFAHEAEVARALPLRPALH